LGFGLLLLITLGIRYSNEDDVVHIPKKTVPQNIILFIGDGMGPEHINLGGLYMNGKRGTMFFESFPHKSQMTTHAADDPITDSAASATAIATGYKVNNGVISLKIPGSRILLRKEYRC